MRQYVAPGVAMRFLVIGSRLNSSSVNGLMQGHYALLSDFLLAKIYYFTFYVANRARFYSVVVITPDFEARFVFQKFPATPVRTRVRPLLLLIFFVWTPPWSFGIWTPFWRRQCLFELLAWAALQLAKRTTLSTARTLM